MAQERSLTQVQPAGMVAMFANSTVPTGWLKCNGQTVSRTTYSELFDAIGTAYGAGNGTTTFTLPDLRGEFIRGLDDGRGVDTGRAIGAAGAASSSAGSVTIPLDGNWPVGGVQYNAPGYIASPYNGAEGHGVVYKLEGSRTFNVSAGTAAPRNLAMLMCIKY